MYVAVVMYFNIDYVNIHGECNVFEKSKTFYSLERMEYIISIITIIVTEEAITFDEWPQLI